MVSSRLSFNLKEPAAWFVIGLCLVVLVPILPILPKLQTFIHPWRPELIASLSFFITLTYLLYQYWGKAQLLDLSRLEINFIILPLLAFIVWSGLSIAWAPSWKSALYHTLVWVEYLIFYLVARQILNHKNGFQTFLIPLTVTLLIIGLPSVVEYLAFLVFGDATTLGLRYAKYGELFNTVCPLVTVGVLRLSGRRFALGLLVVLAMWLFIISTLGRTNLFIFGFGLTAIAGFVFVFKRFRKYRRKMAMIVLAVIFVPLPLHLITFFAEEPNVPLVKRMSDETGISYSTDVRKLLKSVSVEMFKTHPVIGVGADNFGMRFNDYRTSYAAKNPGDVNLMTSEAEVAERAHNEYLQILAELGAVGGLIFLWFLGGVAVMALTALKRLSRISLVPVGALLGVCFFLASSAISSYSFRLVQNGFVFFFALAVAAKFLLASSAEGEQSSTVRLSPGRLKLGYAAGIAACLLLTAYCLTRVASVYYSLKASDQPQVEQAIPYYQTAFWLDGENPTAHFLLGMHLFNAERYPEAVSPIRQSIEGQRASSVDFSYLATAQTMAGDPQGAEATIAESLRLYPLSPFLRARYASLLKANGKAEEAAAQLKIALGINKREANTWWVMMNEGARQASIRAAAESDDFARVMKLNPQRAIYAVVAERELRYPHEKFKIPDAND